jgi:hypothetical protein
MVLVYRVGESCKVHERVSSTAPISPPCPPPPRKSRLTGTMSSCASSCRSSSSSIPTPPVPSQSPAHPNSRSFFLNLLRKELLPELLLGGGTRIPGTDATMGMLGVLMWPRMEDGMGEVRWERTTAGSVLLIRSRRSVQNHHQTLATAGHHDSHRSELVFDRRMVQSYVQREQTPSTIVEEHSSSLSLGYCILAR